MKPYIFLLVFFSAEPLIAAQRRNKAKIEIPKMEDLCHEENAPILSYAELYAEFAAGKDRRELWLDHYKQEVKGLWLSPKGALYLVGKMIAKDRFYFCSYDLRKGHKPQALYLGRYLADSIELVTAKGKPLNISRAAYFLPNRDYSTEFKSNEHSFQIAGRTSDDFPDTCVYSESWFILQGGPDEAANEKVNQLITKTYEEYADLKERSQHCLEKKDFPNNATLSIGLTYAGPRYVSAKIDHVESNAKSADWTGESFNFDRLKMKELEREDLIEKKEDQKVVDAVKERLVLLYGTAGRFKDLSSVSLSFTAQTLIVSFAPVDEQGWYLNAFRVDVPIPFGLIRSSFKPALD